MLSWNAAIGSRLHFKVPFKTTITRQQVYLPASECLMICSAAFFFCISQGADSLGTLETLRNPNSKTFKKKMKIQTNKEQNYLWKKASTKVSSTGTKTTAASQLSFPSSNPPPLLLISEKQVLGNTANICNNHKNAGLCRAVLLP